MKLVIKVDNTEYNPWIKFNDKEEWKKHISIYAPHYEPYRHPEKFPCWAKLIQTITNPNSYGLIFDFIYDFEEIVDVKCGLIRY
jgi:hypothetical protein